MDGAYTGAVAFDLNTGRAALTISRRLLLEGAVAGATAWAMPVRVPVLAYVGSYSSPQGPEGSHGNGEGIYLFRFDPDSGALTDRQLFPNPNNPSWLALDASRTHIYSANEISDGSVSAYAIHHSSGRLTLLNTESSRGAGPAHLSVHPSSKFVFVANYHGGTVAVLPIGSRGELGPATYVHQDEGSPAAARAVSGPPGSFALSGHDKPHAHMIESDPTGRFVLAADLALDRILVYRFDAAKGTLTPHKPAFIPLPEGDGPRHFIFHPNGRWLYTLQEEASTIAVFDFDAGRGAFTPRQSLSTLPKGFAGTNYTSEIRIAPGGRILYAANRLHDTIAWFSIAPDGKLALAGEEWTRGDYPRCFTIDPAGNFLLSCNQRGDSIAHFRIDRQTGALTFTGDYTAVGTPSMLVFLS